MIARQWLHLSHSPSGTLAFLLSSSSRTERSLLNNVMRRRSDADHLALFQHLEVGQFETLEFRCDEAPIGRLEVVNVHRKVRAAQLGELAGEHFRRQMAARFGQFMEIVREGCLDKRGFETRL